MERSKPKGARWQFWKYLIVIGAISTLFPPEGLSILSPSIYSFIWRYVRILVSLAIIALFFLVILNHATIYKHFDYMFLVIVFYIAGITIVRGESVRLWINNYGNAIIILLLISLLRNRIPELLKCINIYLICLCSINLICILLWPDGMYISEKTRYTLNWLLGYKSSFQYYLFPCIFISWLEYEYKEIGSITFAAILALCLVESFLSGNIMLFVASMIITVVSLFNITKLTFILNPRFYFYLIIIINIGVIFFTSVLLSSGLGTAFLLYFNKGTSLGGRVTSIWPTALKRISEAPLFGNGLTSADNNRLIYGMNAAIHSHNQLLEITVIGGYVLLTLFMVWLFLKLRHINKTKDLPASRVTGFSILVIFLMVTVEVFSRNIGTGFWLILILTNYIEGIHDQFSEQITPIRHLKIKGGKLILTREL